VVDKDSEASEGESSVVTETLREVDAKVTRASRPLTLAGLDRRLERPMG
jgi:hypothetical protein